MGKAAYKHFTKAEKAKVKLKGTKKLLPKGLNVTDTNFKVKKIVIKEQLKKYGEGELLSKNHLNLQDLVSRLKHHNVGMKLEALSGLKELVTHYSRAVLGNHLPLLLDAIVKLSLDGEGDIRTSGLKLLTLILNGVKAEQLAPLFTMISSHAICAMTHIDRRIREDSLNLLDVMLDTMPHLTALQAPKLLPHFLDLISDSGSSGRALSLYLDGKMTSEKWRSRVFTRLKKLLTVMLEYNQKEEQHNQPKAKPVKWDPNQHLYLSIFVSRPKDHFTFYDGKVSLGNQIKEHAVILIPLLLDTFVEVVPQNNGDENDEAHLITVTAAALLQCIVDIIHLLWDLLSQSDKGDELTNWFKDTYGNTLSFRLLTSKFPYASTTHGTSKKNTNAILGILKSNKNIDQKCVSQNLGLCYICFQMTTPKRNVHVWKRCMAYLKGCLRNIDRLGNDECVILRKCIEAACKRKDNIYKECALLFDTIARVSLQISDLKKPVSSMLFKFLSGVALDHSLQNLHSSPQFINWLGSLPELLTKPSISQSTLNTIIRLAPRNFETFSKNLDAWIETIIDNLPSLEVVGDENIDAKKSILSLLYWVKDWDQEMVNNLYKAVNTNFLGHELSLHLMDILRLKSENDNDETLQELVCNALLDDIECSQ